MMHAGTTVIVESSLAVAAILLAAVGAFWLNRSNPLLGARLQFGGCVTFFIAFSVGSVLLAYRDGSLVFADHPIGRYGITYMIAGLVILGGAIGTSLDSSRPLWQRLMCITLGLCAFMSAFLPDRTISVVPLFFAFALSNSAYDRIVKRDRDGAIASATVRS